MSKEKLMHSICAVILAGGLGTRLRSVVSDKPKVLANVLGRPFLEYLLDQVNSAGLQNVVMSTGYMGDAVRRTIGKSHGTMRISYSNEDSPLGTGGALRLAMEHCRSDYVLAMNGDSYIDADLRLFLDWFFQTEKGAALILTRVEDPSRFGTVKVGEDGLVTTFVEKGTAQGAGWINAGVYLISRKLIMSMPVATNLSLERDFFPRLAGKRLYGYCCDGKFIDIGTPESYDFARRFGVLTK